MKFSLIEVGSTVTKAYFYNRELEYNGTRVIMFKKHYQENGRLLDSDVDSLVDFIKEVSGNSKVFAFGTSIFRKLGNEERSIFLSRMEKEGIKFEIVTQDEENYYTVMGASENLHYGGKIVVAVGGGGSFEISLVESGKILDKKEYDFGVVDINMMFPDLKEDTVKVNFDQTIEKVKEKFAGLEFDANLLIMAGGDFLYYYEMVPFELEKNTLYENDLEPSMLSRNTSLKYDREIMNKSLDEIKSRAIGNEDWWECARAMRVAMAAIADMCHVEYIVPTRINMIHGLLEKVRKESESEK